MPVSRRDILLDITEFFENDLKIQPGILMPGTNVRKNYTDPAWILLRDPLSDLPSMKAAGVRFSATDMDLASTIQELVDCACQKGGISGAAPTFTGDVFARAAMAPGAVRSRIKAKTKTKTKAESKVEKRAKAKKRARPGS